MAQPPRRPPHGCTPTQETKHTRRQVFLEDTDGAQQTLVILVNFVDNAIQPYTVATA